MNPELLNIKQKITHNVFLLSIGNFIILFLIAIIFGRPGNNEWYIFFYLFSLTPFLIIFFFQKKLQKDASIHIYSILIILISVSGTFIIPFGGTTFYSPLPVILTGLLINKKTAINYLISIILVFTLSLTINEIFIEGSIRNDLPSVTFIYIIIGFIYSFFVIVATVTEFNQHFISTLISKNESIRDIKKSNHMFQRILDNVSAIIFLKDQEGRYKYVNKTFKEVFKTDKNLVGKTDYDFFEEETAEKFRYDDKRIINSQTPEQIEETFTHKNSVLTYFTQKSPLKIVENEFELLGVGVNITKQKKAEEALKESENKLKMAQKMGKIGHWHLNIVNNKLIWSDEVFRIFELKKKKFGATYEDFLANIHPEDREKVHQAYTDSLKNKKNYEIIHRVKLINGNLKYVKENCVTEFDAAGKPIQSMGTVQDITETYLAQEALRENESLLVSTLESIKDGILIVSDNQHTIKTNSSFIKTFNIPGNLLEQENNKSLLDHVKKQVADPERFVNIILEISRSDKPSEDMIYLKDGRIMERLSYPLQGSSPIKGRVWLFRDITEKKRAEEALVERDIKLRGIYEAVPVAIGYTSDRKILGNNKKFHTMTGYTPEETKNRDVRFLYLTQKEYDEVGKKQREQLSGENLSDIETRWKKKDGTVMDVLLRFVALDPDNTDKGITVAALDITERKKFERSLNEKEERLKEAEALAHVGHFYYRIKEDELEWSDELFNIFEVSPDEVSPNFAFFFSFVHPDDRESLLKAYEKSIQEKTPLTHEHRIILKNGKTKYAFASSRAVYDRTDIAVYTLGAYLDITQLKQTELELIKHRDHLEKIVSERTRDLHEANNKLIATNTELSKKNKQIKQQRTELEVAFNKLQKTQHQLVQFEKMASLGILTAGIAHEINNPLNFIQGGANGLNSYFQNTNQATNKKLRTYMEGIRIGVERTAAIVKGLNQFSRETVDLNEKCDIHSILDNCLTILHNQLKNKVNIIRQYTTEPFVIPGNVGKLHQAFLNILTNAEQAIENKGEISISTVKIPYRMLIKITDTGYGIDPSHLSHIMDPFFTTKEPGKGTGLGLSITYKIIQEHKGEIKISSELHKGTKVVVEFPVEN